MNIIKFNKFQLNEKSIEELGNPDRFKSEFSDEDDAIQDLKWYTETIDKLYQNGGNVYRLVFLQDMSDLNTDDLGEHWCVELNQLSNFYDSLEDNDGLPYLITGHLEAGQVDNDQSYVSYEELPHELEVNLTSDPEKYEVRAYRDTPKADSLWETKI